MLPLKDNIPTLRFPVLTVAFIAINCLVFAWQLSLSGDSGSASSEPLAAAGGSERDQVNFEYGAIPHEVTSPGTYCGPVATDGGAGVDVECGSKSRIDRQSGIEQASWLVTLFTSMFMHGGILHLAGNMLFLWVFGNNIEDSMGRPRFIAFYLLAGIAATYAQAALEPSSAVPQIGASGAVAGVLGGYALLHPRARVLTLLFIVFLVTIVEIPAMILLGLWFVTQFLPAVGQVATPDVAGSGGGVAYFAHVGGFIFGLALIKVFVLGRKYADAPGPEPKYPVY